MGFASIFLDCFALAVAFCVLSCVVVCIALLLLFVGCGFLSLSDDCGKKKGAPRWCSLSLFVGCVLAYPIALGITKLLQAVSILRELPTIHAAVNRSLL